ncbi:hypothetical protein [Candidatus Phytoplasma fraxini]|uniref:Lipopolysaccharide assembly protein A domain-containing protein n=1 Tax=Ash yellows phytoplasma TaxID=35780 RepID=A0ABZ2U7T5_ASHYP
MSNWSFIVGFAFAFGFIIGSVFNLFIIKWLDNKIYHRPQNKEINQKTLLKEVEKMMNQKDKNLKDLSLTIKNLHINPQEKEKEILKKDDVTPVKEITF